MLTVPEAARRVGRNPETIRRWIWSGKLRSRKLGTQHFLESEDVDAAAGVDPYAEYDEIEPPGGWGTWPDGTPMPNWAKLLRQDRDEH